MKDFTKALAAVVLSGYASFVAAESVNGCVQEDSRKETKIYFANGVMNGPDVAYSALQELQSYYKRTLEAEYPDEKFTFQVAHNESNGFHRDLIEVFEQKSIELGMDHHGLTPYALLELLAMHTDDEEIYSILSGLDWIKDRARLIASFRSNIDDLRAFLGEQIAKALSERRSVESKHTGYYEGDLIAGKRVFVIAHSQGNLFTNAALEEIHNRHPRWSNSIRSIGVASPADRTIGENNYFTAHDDWVINGLRLIAPVLESNVDNEPTNEYVRSPLNHSFFPDYLWYQLNSRQLIDTELLLLAKNTPYPEAEAGEGAIRATLRWGSEPDVDLHAFEPSGAHVYYADRYGDSGHLDIDDTSYFGPENYFVACDAVVAGRYQFGVNYYRGSQPVEAEITLYLGDGRAPITTSTVLGESRGQSGNYSPIILQHVDVSIDPDTGRASYVTPL